MSVPLVIEVCHLNLLGGINDALLKQVRTLDLSKEVLKMSAQTPAS